MGSFFVDKLPGIGDVHGINNGPSYNMSIPGNVIDVWNWLMRECSAKLISKQAVIFGESFIFLEQRQVSVVLSDFQRVTDSRSTFHIVYHPDYKFFAYRILSSLGGAFSADWFADVNKVFVTLSSSRLDQLKEVEKDASILPALPVATEVANSESPSSPSRITKVNINIQGNNNGNIIVGDDNKIEH